MPLRLTVFVPGRPGATVVLADGRQYRLGRDPASDLEIYDDRISREHLVFDGRGPAWRARDLGSKNGTRADGVPIAAIELRRRSWLSVGGVPVLVEPVSAADAAAAEVTTERRRIAAQRECSGLVPGSPPDVLTLRALEAMRRIADCQRAGYWICDADGTPRIGRVLGASEPPPTLGTMRQVVMTGEPVFCSDTAGAETLARRDSVAGGGLRAIVALPLDRDGRVTGVLYADSLRPGKVFTQLDAELLGAVAEQLALTLAASDLQTAVG